MFFQNEAVTAFKKARHQYFQRCDELEKAKAVTAKAVDDIAGIKTLDKRKKSKDEAQSKVLFFIYIYFFSFFTVLLCIRGSSIEAAHPAFLPSPMFYGIKQLVII